jgi:hypothetical protein
MSRDDIIRMAREAGAWSQQFKNRDVEYVMSAESLGRFAAAEREACAQVAEDSDHVVSGRGYYDQLGDADATARNIAIAIRARGQE